MSWFKFKGIDSRTMPVIVREPAPVIRAEERVKNVNVLGRTGTLTLTEGDNVCNPYMQTIPIYVKGVANVREVFNWLNGSGWLTLNTDAGTKQMARIVNAITMDRPTYHLDCFEGNIVFYCQPIKYSSEDEPKVLVANDTEVTVNNTGDLKAFPKIYVYYGGSSDITLTVNGKAMTLKLTQQDNTRIRFLVDCETNELWRCDADLNPVECCTQYTEGDFPVLNAGNNTVSCSGGGTTAVNRTYLYVNRRFL